LLERTAVCLLGGFALAGGAAVGYRAGTLNSPLAQAPPAVARAPSEPQAEAEEDPQVPGASRSPRQQGGEDADDSAVFAALERLERRMAAGMSRARASVVALEYSTAEGPAGSRRLATGVVINSSGDVLSVRIDPPAATAAAANPAAILARDASGRRHAAKWVAGDPESGLTLLRIAPNAVKPIVIAAEAPILGSQVFVVGNPFGLGHSVGRGHIAGLDRALKLGQRQVGGLIQVQAPLYPGDSGAVVTNLKGQLLGLIRSGLAIPAAPGAHAERDNDFGFAIGTRDLLWVADQLRARGRVDRAYLGVRLHSTNAPEPSEPGPAPRDQAPPAGPDGAYLQEVLSGTPAAKAGLRAGDAIVALDGLPIHSSPDLTDRLDRLPAQATIQIEVLRGPGPARRPLKVALQTTSRPESEQQAVASPGPGGKAATPATSITVIPTAAPATPPASGPPAAERSPPTREAAAKAAPPEPREKPADPAPVSIPAPARSPLRAPVPPAQAEELKLTLPRVVAERLEHLERRLEKLERQAAAGPRPAGAKPEKEKGKDKSP
jgi:S1-C subfamily serine protease